MKFFSPVSFLVYLPIFSALLLPINSIVFKSYSDKRIFFAKSIAILTSVLLFFICCYLLFHFDLSTPKLQFVERYFSISRIGFEVFYAIDGLSLYFLFLTVLVSFIAKIYGIYSIKTYIVKFLFCLFLLEAFCIGVFVSLNLLLFYCFFEMVLVPMYFIIGIWGGGERIYAAMKFFLYSFFGSLMFLVALIYIYVNLGNFNIIDLYSLTDSFNIKIKKMLWFLIIIAFIIKIPLVPFHTWLPNAHVQAPTSGSLILAGVLLKLGGYGIIRVLFPMFADVSCLYSKYMVYLSAFAVIYGSLVALNKTDIKEVIAYSSVAHMGYVTGGIFSITVNGLMGAVFQMLSHGIISTALFLIVGILHHRFKTRSLDILGGVASHMPNLSYIFMFIVFASIAVPGSSGFIAEFLSILGIFQESVFIGIIFVLGVILCPIYMLNLYRRVMFGDSMNNSFVPDLFIYEKYLLLVLLFFMYCFGIFPSLVLNGLTSYVNHYLLRFIEVL